MKALNIPTNGVRREGINTMQLRWTRMMDKTNLQLDIAAVHGNAKDVINDYSELGCKVYELPDRQKYTLAYIMALYKLLKKEKYDVVHVHGSSGIIGIELFIARLTGVSIRIAHSRNTMCDHSRGDTLFRPLLYANMTHALACSTAAGEWLFGKHPFEVMHNGIDTSIYEYNGDKRVEVRTKYNLGDFLVAGFIGNIKEQKNPSFLIDIFFDLHKKKDNTVLLVVGDGTMRKKTEEKVTSLGLQDCVYFIGRSDKVSTFMQAMDFLLLPSLYEGFGNVALEAQIAGLPVFASDQIPRDCGLTELVTFLPIDQGTETWTNTILNTKLSSDLERKAAYSNVCKRMKEDHFDLVENVKRLRELYTKVEE